VSSILASKARTVAQSREAQRDRIDSENLGLFLRIRKQKTTLDNALSETSASLLRSHLRVKSGGPRLELAKRRTGTTDTSLDDRSRLRLTSFDGGVESTEDILEGIRRFRKAVADPQAGPGFGLRRKTFGSATDARLSPAKRTGFFQPLKRRPHARQTAAHQACPPNNELIYVGNFCASGQQSVCFEVRVQRGLAAQSRLA